ncbi:SCO7613 C-terminal domain-containing membrane protein [Nonomuraea antimicrobica]
MAAGQAGQGRGEIWAAGVAGGTALTLIAVVAAPAQPALDGLGTGWRPLAYVVPALAVALAAGWLPWRRVRLAGMAIGGLVALLTTLTAAPRLAATLVAPLAWLDVLWTGTWTGGVAAVRDGVADGCGGAGHGGGRPSGGGCARHRRVAGEGGGVRCVGVRGTHGRGRPQAFAAPHPAAVAVQVVLAVATAAAATLGGRVPWWAVACAIVAGSASVRAAAYAFGSEQATLIVLPILAVAATAMALVAGLKELRVWGMGSAALFFGLEAVAVGFSLGLRVLVAMSVGFAVAGVLVLLMSLRAGTAGKGLRYTGVVLLLLASWLRLGADEVTVVEAYTVPCSLVLLGVGWWRRRGAAVSSWAAYGAGLSFTMLPSLVAVYSDAEWQRSLALGVLALAVLFAGVRVRLQAPTVIGAFVVAGVAVRELAPYVSEMLLTVPRWVPIAVGGLLLVVAGATYEARMRDLRRLRDNLTAMG